MGGTDVSFRGQLLFSTAIASACGGSAPPPPDEPKLVTVEAPSDQVEPAKGVAPPDRDVSKLPPEPEPQPEPDQPPEPPVSGTPVVCGGVTCGAGMPGLLASCCTPGGSCGISLPTGQQSCFPLNAPGRVEPSCAPAGVPGVKGCCTPQGVCGVMFGAMMPISLGCFTGLPMAGAGAKTCTP